MKLQINITKEVLERSHMCGFAKTGSLSENCAIAVAIKDLFPYSNVPSGSYINVFRTEKGFKSYRLNRRRLSDDPGVNVILPDAATRFITEFDISTSKERLSMQPISFEIDVPDEVIDSTGIEQVKQVLNDHPFMQEVKS